MRSGWSTVEQSSTGGAASKKALRRDPQAAHTSRLPPKGALITPDQSRPAYSTPMIKTPSAPYATTNAPTAISPTPAMRARVDGLTGGSGTASL